MDLNQALKQRHSVRSYDDRPIPIETLRVLQEEIDLCNTKGDLHIQLVTDEPKAFDGFPAHYGKFHGVRNYIVLAGEKNSSLHEKCGYYGEQLVLKAVSEGLDSCWVALTFSKISNAFEIAPNEKLVAVIALGYGKTKGVSHTSKPAEKVSNISSSSPEWFKNGIEYALLAPTAMNQQKFFITYSDGGKVSAKAGIGFYTKLDLGIVKYHFEFGAGKENFSWI